MDVSTLENFSEVVEREALLQGRMKHENIVTLIDVKIDAARGYLIMELCRETLDQFWRRRDLGQVTYREILRSIACGLEFIHGENHIHRDVKSTNILRKNFWAFCFVPFIVIECEFPTLKTLALC